MRSESTGRGSQASRRSDQHRARRSRVARAAGDGGIRVVGDRVLVGGVIVRSPTPGTIGHTSTIAVDDGGPGGEDRLGFAFSNSGLDACPDIALPMHPVTSGNFVVR